MKMGVGKDLLHLFHILEFDESLRMAEGLFRRRETASEGRERGDPVTKGGGDNKERLCHREGGKMSADTS